MRHEAFSIVLRTQAKLVDELLTTFREVGRIGGDLLSISNICSKIYLHSETNETVAYY